MVKMEIREIFEQDLKSKHCNQILRQLPEWFAVEESIEEYVQKVRKMPFWVAFEKETPIGFLAIKIHNIYTAEVCVMGILKGYHRHGIGSELIAAIEDFCKAKGFQYLTVKTLDDSVDFEPYERTRQFYNKMGFIPLEVFPLYWDEANPCLFLVKYLG